MLSSRWSPIQCPECGAKSVMDMRLLIRPFLTFAGVTIVYLGGILWALFLRQPPLWLAARAGLIAVVWFAPFLAAALWVLRQLFRFRLRVIEDRQKPGEQGAL